MDNHSQATTPGVVVITVECADCGRVKLRPTQVTITVSGETTRYTYTCPLCGTPRTREATPAVLTMLARATRRHHYLATHPATREVPRG